MKKKKERTALQREGSDFSGFIVELSEAFGELNIGG